MRALRTADCVRGVQHDPTTNQEVPFNEKYDKVVIATSLELGHFQVGGFRENFPGIEQQYKDRFFTHFTTFSTRNATFFNRTGTMPQKNILTTVEADSTTAPSFLSLNLLRQVIVPRNDGPQNLYRIVSRAENAEREIVQYLTPSNAGSPRIITCMNRQRLPRSVPVTSLDGETNVPG